MKSLLTSLLFTITVAATAEKAPLSIKNIRFLNKTIAAGKIIPFESVSNKPETEITAFLKHVKVHKADEQLRILQQQRNLMELNDWLYFKLIRELSKNISNAGNDRVLYTWYFLNRSGYDSRLIGQGSDIFVFVQSRDSVYDESYFSLGKKIYVRLPLDRSPEENIGFSLYKFSFLEGIKAFHLNDSRAPKYTAIRTLSKEISFVHANKTFTYILESDPELLALYMDKPNGGLRYSFTAGLSEVARASLIPQIKNDLNGMNIYEGVQFLLSLTRNSFEYKNDLDYGRENYMTAEETLLADASDCEDRAALFYYLVREIYQLPMLVLLYPAHVTVAVNFGNDAYGEAVNFRGRKYSICEPTGPGNELKIGEAPDFINKQGYSILFAYQPN